MTPEHRRTLTIETIRALQIGTPISRELVMVLLEPWPALYLNALARGGGGGISRLRAPAAGIDRDVDDYRRPPRPAIFWISYGSVPSGATAPPRHDECRSENRPS